LRIFEIDTIAYTSKPDLKLNLACRVAESAIGCTPTALAQRQQESVMAFTIRTVASVLAGSAMVLVLSMPVSAAGLSVGASVGGSGGVNAGVGASVGGSGGVNAGVGASVGGGSGINAGAGANVGGSNGASAGLGASVGGSNGINAGASANVGGTDGVTAGLGANVGGTSGIGVGVGIGGGTNPSSLSSPSNPSNLGNPTQSSLPGVVAQMSSSQVARMKKRCVDVLSSEGSYDRDLRQLCLLIARR